MELLQCTSEENIVHAERFMVIILWQMWHVIYLNKYETSIEVSNHKYISFEKTKSPACMYKPSPPLYLSRKGKRKKFNTLHSWGKESRPYMNKM